MPGQIEVNCADLYEATVEYIMDLFTGTPKESFSRDEILVILSLVKNDPEAIVLLRRRMTKL